MEVGFGRFFYRSEVLLGRLDVQTRQPIEEGATGHLQLPRGLALVASIAAQAVKQQPAFELVEALLKIGGGLHHLFCLAWIEVAGQQLATLTKQNRTLDLGLELAHIAWEALTVEQGQCFR